MKQDVNTQNQGTEKVTMNDIVKTLNTAEKRQLENSLNDNKHLKLTVENLINNNPKFQDLVSKYFVVRLDTKEDELLETVKEAFKTFFEANRIFKNQDFKVGDLVSSKFQNQFLKGKIVEIKKNTLVIKHLSKGLIEVPKKSAQIMFPGQKYDAREIYPLFPKGGLEYKDLPKHERLKLLSGKETKPFKIEYFREYKNEIGEPIKKMISETVKFQIQKDYKNNSLVLKPIKAFGNRIYNKELSNDEISKLKNGEILKTEITTKAGKTFSAILFWDKDLKGVRAKAPNTKPKQELTFKGYKLDKSELEKLNKGENVKIEIQNQKGETIPYTLKYNMEFDHLQFVKGDTKISNGLAPNEDFDGDGLTNAQEESIGSSKYSADTDGDGLTDAQEVKKGTDPNEPQIGKEVGDFWEEVIEEKHNIDKTKNKRKKKAETKKEEKESEPKKKRRTRRKM